MRRGVARMSARLPAHVNPWSVHPLAITSIDYVKRPEVMRSLEPLVWDIIVFDEAHGLAGRSDRAAAAAALGRRARTLVLLTATPHVGDDGAFHRLCDLGHLDDGPLLWFRRTRAGVGIRGSRRTVLLRIRPTPAEAAMHEALLEYGRLIWRQSAGVAAPAARLAVTVLLRRACSSADSLARSIERRMTMLADTAPTALVQPVLPFDEGNVGDEEPGTVLGGAGLRDAEEERACLGRILALARSAALAESKLAALCRLFARTREPAIVFTEYRDTLQRLASTLPGVDAVQLHGGLGRAERLAALRGFTEGPARLLLATDAASEGLNLHQRCRLVVNLELPWTPLRLEQRAGRVDRIGQPRRVHALHLVAARTSEEDVLAKLAARMSRMDDVLSSAGRLPGAPEVAACVVGGLPLPAVGASTPPPGRLDITAPDLAPEARAEAARIAAARALISPLDPHRDRDGRAVIACIPSGRGRAAGPRCFWVFRVVFAAADGRVFWEALLPLAAAADAASSRSTARTRALLDPRHPAVQHVVTAAQEEQLHCLQHAVRRAAQVWVRRESALTAALRQRHARLSTGLLQLALFDRRDQRMAAAQSALLEDALSQSIARTAELAGYDTLRVECCDLVLAVGVG